MFGLFKKEPVLDEASVHWLIDVFAWAIQNFDAQVFRKHTTLVLPTNEFFSGSVSSVEGMAGLIFDHTLEYAGMAHWPYRLVDQNTIASVPAPNILLEGTLRRPGGIKQTDVTDANRMVIPYDPSLVNNPEALIAAYAQTLAHYLASMSPERPPGGADNWAYTTEVLGVFLGFGVMLANTSKTHQIRSCASCGPTANRVSSLSQFDTTYALAIFATLKGLPAKTVAKQLKPELKGYFQKAYREINNQSSEVQLLLSSIKR